MVKLLIKSKLSGFRLSPLAQATEADGRVIVYDYAPAVDQILASEAVSPATYDCNWQFGGAAVDWFLTDNQGTVRDVLQQIAPAGAVSVVDHLVYDAFGQITSQTAPGSQPRFAYDGDQLDSTSGLYDDGSQWYDPAAGVYVSDNPRGLAAGDTNLSRFCGNSPPNRADLGGLGLNGSSQRPRMPAKPLGSRRAAASPLPAGPSGRDPWAATPAAVAVRAAAARVAAAPVAAAVRAAAARVAAAARAAVCHPGPFLSGVRVAGQFLVCTLPALNLPDGGYGEANLGGGYLGGDGYLVGLASGVVFVGSGVDNNSPRMLGSAAMPPLAPGMITGGTYPGFPPFDVRVDPGSLFPEGGGGPGISSADNNGNTGRGSTLRGPVPVPPTPSADNNGNSGRSSTLPGPIPPPPTRP